ncbi:thioesterase family protein [Sciscionella sediminilitoris]|uniref:thioesterase family protein n=1 Tax=Sciscionella sediminilitoris TaxID=1445613 RepID=UPI0006897CF9|nr:thioesterase family protein [Sciscionella sp. SE31]
MPEQRSGRVVTPYEGSGHREWDDTAEIPAPLALHSTKVRPEWVDYNGHMSESCYLLVFGDGADAFFRFIGIDEQYREAGHSLYTVETHLHNRREVAEGEPIRLHLWVLDQDAKRVHLFQEMYHGDGALLATAEQLLVHVDMTQGKSCPLPERLRHRLQKIQRAHELLARPEVLGRPMGIRRG